MRSQVSVVVSQTTLKLSGREQPPFVMSVDQGSRKDPYV